MLMVIHWKTFLAVYRVCEGLLLRAFFVNPIKITLWEKHIPRRLTCFNLLECDRCASGLRRGNILDMTMKVMFRDICKRVPATCWLYNYLILFTENLKEVILNCPMKKNPTIQIRLGYLCHQHVETANFPHLLGSSDVYSYCSPSI